MRSVLNILWIYLCGSVTSQAYNLKETKIIDGEFTEISKFPYLVRLEKSRGFICGGAMVSKTHVVTAAHCVHGVKAAALTVVGGATYLNQRAFRRQVILIMLPQGWTEESWLRDLAVLKLRTPMPDSVPALPICSRQLSVGAETQTAGWGITRQRGVTLSNRLRTITSSVISQKNCQKAYAKIHTPLPSMFCVSNANGQDTCQGDSGGPVVYKGELCGVVSWGFGCGNKDFPAVNTNVYNLRRFIARALTL